MSAGPFTVFRSLAAAALAIGASPTDDPTTKPSLTTGAGAPSASEPNGSIYLRTDGAADTTVYARVSGAWVAIEGTGGSIDVSVTLTAGTAPSGGATDTTITGQLKDSSNTNIASSRRVMLVAKTTEYGPITIDTSVTFTNPGGSDSIVAQGNGWVIVDTSATGEFVLTASNSTDETVYFTCVDAGSNSSSVSKACYVMACAPISVTWSA